MNMTQPCAVEDCAELGTDTVILAIEMSEDMSFSMSLCTDHSTNFRVLAGDRFTDDLGFGVTVFNARLVD